MIFLRDHTKKKVGERTYGMHMRFVSLKRIPTRIGEVLEMSDHLEEQPIV